MKCSNRKCNNEASVSVGIEKLLSLCPNSIDNGDNNIIDGGDEEENEITTTSIDKKYQVFCSKCGWKKYHQILKKY